MQLCNANNRWPHSLIWNASPAGVWEDGYPLGNGELGAMVLGGVGRERVALNHESLWRGKYRDRDLNDTKYQHLDKIRNLFFAGRVKDAGTLANELLGSDMGGMSGPVTRVNPFQPAGNMFIDFEHFTPSGYRRELDLDRAVATITYQNGEASFKREYFVHSQYPVIVMRLTGTGAEVKAAAMLDTTTLRGHGCRYYVKDNEIGVMASFDEGVNYAVLAQAYATNGSAASAGYGLDQFTNDYEPRIFGDGADASEEYKRHPSLVIDAEEVLILLTIGVATDGGDPTQICRANLEDIPTSWDELLQAHVTAHQELYRKVRVQLGDDNDDKPSDMRVAEFRSKADDPGLYALVMNYGRYLLISSSRTGGLPANLQGVWNENYNPPWESDFHLDINLQMNYWFAEQCGLGECHKALFDFTERFIPHGRKVARQLYDCRGVYLPHALDPWGCATPEAQGYDVWTGAAAWMAQHYWWHYEYTLDKEFLATRAYPFMKEVALFYQDYLVPHPDKGWLVAVPSYSPENIFKEGCYPVSLSISCTMDNELIYEVLTHAIKASEILDTDEELRKEWQSIIKELPPFQIGQYGQLQEWIEDYEEVYPGHHHLSHLYAFYPGDQITIEDEPELSQAVRKSLERRLSSGGVKVCFNMCWAAACWARFGEGSRAQECLKDLVQSHSSHSLLTYECWNVFQVDGNLGATAAICEMLLQSHRGVIRLLPALPDTWKDGCITGLKARGNIAVDLSWADGKLTEARLTMQVGGAVKVKYSGICQVDCDGCSIAFNILDNDIIRFATEPGKTYTITC